MSFRRKRLLPPLVEILKNHGAVVIGRYIRNSLVPSPYSIDEPVWPWGFSVLQTWKIRFQVFLVPRSWPFSQHRAESQVTSRRTSCLCNNNTVAHPKPGVPYHRMVLYNTQLFGRSFPKGQMPRGSRPGQLGPVTPSRGVLPQKGLCARWRANAASIAHTRKRR